MRLSNINHRKTQKQKEANDFKYYKDIADSISTSTADNIFSFSNNQEQSVRFKVNYDLYNGIINVEEFNYVCKPFGDQEVGQLPARLVNRDIVSGKIKAVESMEITEPFDFSVIAVNPEATTRKEKEKFDRIKQYVEDIIMQPITLQIQQQYEGQLKGRKLTEEENQQMQQEMQQQIDANTPPEVEKYMAREHQDPAEMLAVHLLNYISFKEDFKRKANIGWKHACLSAHEIYYVNHDADLQPTLQVVNPINIIYESDENVDFIEDLDWFAVEYHLTTNQIIKMFGDEITEDEIDKLYEESSNFTFNNVVDKDSQNFHQVLHITFVSLRKVGFLMYIDENGEQQETIIPEDYKMNTNGGDVNIEWKWIPEVHEVFKINDDIYKRMGAVLGQIIDVDNLYNHKLPYYGVVYDNLNSEPTSLMDRMKHYQYYYNIIMYRIEQLLASDKGKILMMNINAIPRSAGIDLNKFLYYAEALKIGFYNPNEEGNRGDQSSASNIAKEVDMSLASDIQKYIGLAEYIERRCGESVGINKNIEGQTPHNEAVGNAQMNFNQAAGILQTYYDLHNIVKRNLLTGLLEKTKVLYSLNPQQRKLQYILDDMTLSIFEVDEDLLDNSVYGIFVTNNAASKIAKQAVQQLAHSAMQNDKANLSQISKVIRASSIQEAEELLEQMERDANERAMELEKMKGQQQEKAFQMQTEENKKEFEREKELIILKETEKRETEIQKQLILSMGFNEDKDADKDGELDILEVAKKGIEADIKLRKQDLEEKKFTHQKEKDAQQISIMKSKITQNQ